MSDYIMKLSMYGSFPGSPDHDYYALTLEEFEELLIRFRYRARDTLEEVRTDE